MTNDTIMHTTFTLPLDAKNAPFPAPKSSNYFHRPILFFIGGRNYPTFALSPANYSPPHFRTATVKGAFILRKCCNNQTSLPSLVPRPREATTQLAVHEHEVVTQPTEFSRIFEAHHGMIFRTAYRITGNAADAEDVLQTIFLRLLRQPAGATALDQEESYLRRAAVNASLDVIRQKQASRSVPLIEAAARATEPPPAENGLKDCLRRALRKLTERSAEIFTLRYFEDLTNQQIAGALDISQVLVAVSLHRSRRQLQKEIRMCMGGQSQ